MKELNRIKELRIPYKNWNKKRSKRGGGYQLARDSNAWLLRLLRQNPNLGLLPLLTSERFGGRGQGRRINGVDRRGEKSQIRGNSSIKIQAFKRAGSDR
jgi:hypothetical protein